MQAADESGSRELALLRLVERHRGEASWYRLGRDLTFEPVPPAPDMMQMLKQLAAAGFVSRTLCGGGMDAWAVTEAGARWLAEASRHTWQLGPLEAEELARQLAPAQIPGAAMHQFFDLGARRPASIRQLLAIGAPPAALAMLAHSLDEAAWKQLFAQLQQHPLDEATLAAFHAALRPEPPPAAPRPAAPPADAVHCHIVYPEEVTACGAPPTRHDVYAYRTDRIDSVIHRATWLGGPGGRPYALCEACIAAHRPPAG